jgi:hypothetical protein
MKFFKGARSLGRKARRGLRRGRRILGKAVGTANTILGTVNKLSGGAAKAALMSHALN